MGEIRERVVLEGAGDLDALISRYERLAEAKRRANEAGAGTSGPGPGPASSAPTGGGSTQSAAESAAQAKATGGGLSRRPEERVGISQVSAQQEDYRRQFVEPLRQAEARFGLARSVAFSMSRGQDPLEDERIRARAAMLSGTSDEAQIDSTIREAQAAARDKNLVRYSRRTMGGSLFRQLSALGAVAAAGDIGTAVAAGLGSGSGAMLDQHLTSIGSLVGMGVGSAFGPEAAPIGQVIGATLGGFGSAYARGAQSRLTMLATLQGTTGYGAGSAALANGLRDLQDPTASGPLAWLARNPIPLPFGGGHNAWERWFGAGLVGTEGAAKVLGAIDPMRASGFGDAELRRRARALLTEYGPEAGATVGQIQARFYSDPAIGARTRRFGANSYGAAREALSDRDLLASLVRTQGLGATEQYLSAFGKQNLSGTAAQIALREGRAEYNLALSGLGTGYASTRMQEVMGTGNLAVSPLASQALEQSDRAHRAYAQALERRASQLDKSYSLQEREQAATLRLQAAQERTAAVLESYQQGVLGRQQGFTLAGSAVGETGSAYELAKFGAAIGASPAGAEAHLSALRQQVDTAEANAKSASSPLERASWRAAAAQLRVQAAEFGQSSALYPLQGRAASHGLAAESYSAFYGLRESAGAGYSELGGLLESSLDENRSALGAWERARLKAQTPEAQLQAIGQINTLRAGIASQETLRDYLHYRRAETEMRNRTRVFEARSGYLSMLGRGVGESLALAGETYGLRSENVARLSSEASFARRRRDTRRADELDAEANRQHYLAQGEYVSALGDIGPSARMQLEMGGIGLGIALASGDIGMGGQVPTSMRRALLGTNQRRLSEIDQIVAAAGPGERDAVAARYLSERAGLLQSSQEQRNALQFGDMGRLVNLSAGLSGDWTMFGPSLRDFQRYNPGGSRAFGGSGSDVGLSPFAASAVASALPGGMAGAMGGAAKADPEVVGVLREILKALQTGGGFSASPGALSGGTGATPAAMAKKAANGSPF